MAPPVARAPRKPTTRRALLHPRPALHARKRELVRSALRSAAEELFAARGFEPTTVEQIAREAGVSRRTFFRYYASKEDVLVASTDRLADELVAALAARPKAEPPLLAVRRALVPVLERALANRDFARTMIRLVRESSVLRRAILDRHSRMEERLAALLARRLRLHATRDVTPWLLAFVTRALVDTAINVWFDRGAGDVEELVEEIFATLDGQFAALRVKGRRGRARDKQ